MLQEFYSSSLRVCSGWPNAVFSQTINLFIFIDTEGRILIQMIDMMRVTGMKNFKDQHNFLKTL